MASSSALAPVWLVGFCGHRPRPGSPGRSPEEIEACAPHLTVALEQMQGIAEEQGGRIELFTGLAEGADLVAIEQARKLDIPVHAILPLPLEQFREDFEAGSPALSRMDGCLDAILRDPRGSVRVSEGSHERPDCYSDAGYQIIALSDACLFLDNGEASAGKGGTHDMIEIARRLDRPHWIVNPSEPDAPVQELADFAGDENPDLVLLREIQSLADDPGASGDDEETSDVFHNLDRNAANSSRTVRSAAIWSAVANGGAAIVAAFAIIFYEWLARSFGAESARYLTLFELLFVLSAVIFSLWLMRPRRQDDWLHSRIAAEMLRGLRSTRGILDPLSPPIPESHRIWRRFALAASLNDPSRPEEEVSTLRDRYLTERLDTQIAYFNRSHRRSKRSSRFISSLFLASTWLAIPFVMLLIGAKFAMPFSEIPGIIKFLPILFPLTSGILSALNHAFEISRRSSHYEGMSDLLTEGRSLLEKLDTDSSIRLAISRLEQAIVQEQLEWLASVRAWTGR